MNNKQPVYKVVYEESIINNNVIPTYTIYVKLEVNNNMCKWFQLYKGSSLPEVQIALKRLKEIFYPTVLNFLQGKEPIMYEVNGYVYKTEMVLPEQSCIVGEYIIGNKKYNDYYEGPIKHDYLNDYISFYNKGHVLVVGRQVFLDGDMIISEADLIDCCKLIGQDIECLDYKADKLIKFIANHYPEAAMYTCGGYTNFDIRR